MPDRVPLSSRRRGFTFVELLLAIVLAVLVAGILALLLRTLLAAGTGQAARLRGPFAARATSSHSRSAQTAI